MKLGGLFSGIGGFELAWTRLGGEVAWMCEVDPAARRVLAARFPSVPIFPDIRELDPQELPPVDVVTGGSPCQGFSIAGHRAGLGHGESRLFSDYIRVVDGLAGRGLSWAVWENVPGVLSIEDEDGNRTFEHVVAALAGGAEPVRLRDDRRWNAGMAVRRDRAVAWRVLDSRYFGVAQRRRRIFACVALGDTAPDRAGRALLAVAEGVRRHPEARDTAWRDSAAGAGSRPQGPAGYRMTAFGQYEDDDTASTVKQRDYKDATDLVTQPAILMTMREGKDGGGKGPLLAEEHSLTLATGNNQALFQHDREAYGVRRLTPVECERLQAFPDGWTEPAGSDAARYRALGNAVTVSTVQWILTRVKGIG